MSELGQVTPTGFFNSVDSAVRRGAVDDAHSRVGLTGSAYGGSHTGVVAGMGTVGGSDARYV